MIAPDDREGSGSAAQADSHPPGWRRLIALLALPRSGTTMTTAVFGAHSQVLEVYEPWNDASNGLDGEQRAAFAPFVARFAPDPAGRSTLFVKETTTRPFYIDRVAELLDDAPPGTETALLILLRNPFHVFLSGYHARRDWWGQPDLALDLKTFNAWARNALTRYKKLAELATRQDALLVSYERLVHDRGAVAALMATVGLPPEPQQVQFGEHIDLRRVRGDPKLTAGSLSVSKDSVAARQREFVEIRPMLQQSPQFRALRRIARHTAELSAVQRASGVPAMVRAMLGQEP